MVTKKIANKDSVHIWECFLAWQAGLQGLVCGGSYMLLGRGAEGNLVFTALDLGKPSTVHVCRLSSAASFECRGCELAGSRPWLCMPLLSAC